jgi:hypothetical protein
MISNEIGAAVAKLSRRGGWFVERYGIMGLCAKTVIDSQPLT